MRQVLVLIHPENGFSMSVEGSCHDVSLETWAEVNETRADGRRVRWIGRQAGIQKTEPRAGLQ